MGNHNLSVGDVDGDGRDEIMYGASRDRRRRDGAVQHGPGTRGRDPHVGHGSRSARAGGVPAAREPVAVRPERARAARRAHRRPDLRRPGLGRHRPGPGARRRSPLPRLRDVGIGSDRRHVHRAAVDTQLGPRAARRPDLARRNRRSTSASGGTAISCASCSTARRSPSGTGSPATPPRCSRRRASRRTTAPRPRRASAPTSSATGARK